MKTLRFISALLICTLPIISCNKNNDSPFVKKITNVSRIIESRKIVEDIATGKVTSNKLLSSSTIIETISWRLGMPSHYTFTRDDKIEVDSDFTYENGQIVKIINHDGETGDMEWTFTYDNGRMTKISSANSTNEFSYDIDGHITTIMSTEKIDDEEIKTEIDYEYSGDNVVKSTEYTLRSDGSPMTPMVTTYEYSTLLNPYRNIFVMNVLESPDMFVSLNVCNHSIQTYNGFFIQEYNIEINADGDYPKEEIMTNSSTSESDGKRTTILNTAKFTFEYKRI